MNLIEVEFFFPNLMRNNICGFFVSLLKQFSCSIIVSFVITMNAAHIVIPFDFPFAILERRANPDANKKLVYAVADGQYTYGPLSLFQYHNDEKYSKIIRNDQLPVALPCKEYYIVESGYLIEDAIEIDDAKRGRIYIKEIHQEPQQIRMKELIQEISECRHEIRSLKSLVLSEERVTRQSFSVKQRSGSNILNTPPRSQSVTTNRILLKNVKSSGYGQRTPIPKRSLRQ